MDSTPHKTRILFVEDDQILSAIYQDRLRAEGYTVLESFDGDAALAMYQEFHPDLVVCDIMMPRVSGFEVVRQLRQDPAAQNLKIIVMSALSQDEHIEKAKELGADDYIVKSRTELDEVVERIKALVPPRQVEVKVE